MAPRGRLIVFEDFGTSGLTGDPREWEPRSGVKNHFYHFFRAEGRSSKGERDLGRWGIGKQVFPRASRINSIWGLTVRADDRRKLLMGMAVFKSHNIDGHRHLGDGLLGAPGRDNEPIPPIEDPGFIAEFERVFECARGDRPGLSIVVPWRDPEITGEGLVRAAAKGFFWPILCGQLEVIVDIAGSEVRLNTDSIVSQVHEMEASLRDELLPLIRLAAWARSAPKPDLTATPRDFKWSSDAFAQDELDSARTRWNRNERVAVRVQLNVARRGSVAAPTHFDVFLCRDGGDDRGVPIFIREGIIIPEVRKRATPRLRGVRCLVVASDGPIATLLGDAENPAHTEWQKDGANFKGKYANGASVLELVKRSAAEVAGALNFQEVVQDRTLLASVFSIPAEAVGEAVQQEPKQDAKTGEQPEKPTPPARRPQLVVIDKVGGGFVVRAGDAKRVPSRIVIRAAYQIRSGNPLKRYQVADFEFARTIHMDVQGARELAVAGNMLEVEVQHPEFRIALTGFDSLRDVYARVVPMEAEDAGTEA